MSIEILDCLKRKRDICIKNIIPSQNTAFGFTPALKVQQPQNFFHLYTSPYFSDHHCEKIIVVAILVNFLRIFKVRKISSFPGHDRAVAKNGASWPVTSSKDNNVCEAATV